MERPSLLSTDTTANKISYYHIVLFMASLPFDLFFSHIILISFTAHTLIQLKRRSIKPIFTRGNLLLQSVFFITLFSTIYTIDRPQAFQEWGRHLVILLFPVLFCLSPFAFGRYRSNLLVTFSLVCTLTVAYLYVDSFHTILHYDLPLSSIFSAAFTNHNFSEPIGMHATFFSLQLAIALVYLLSELIKPRAFFFRFFYAACAGLLLAGIIQLSSKSVFAALLIAVNWGIPYFLLTGKQRLKFMVIAVTLTALTFTGILTFGVLKTRYLTHLQYDLSYTNTGQPLDSRLDRWKTANQLIAKKPIIGYGAGSELGLLHEHFFTQKYYSSFLNHLNAHNQYLSMLLKSGGIGLVIYLGTLMFGFKQAWRSKDLLFFTFMLLVASVSFSENLLDVDKGVMVYAFFFSFFMYSRGDETSV